MRKVILSLFVIAAMGMGMPAAHAGINCKWIPSMCPAQSDPESHGNHGVPEPGTLGLLAMGAAASIGMLRRRKR